MVLLYTTAAMAGDGGFPGSASNYLIKWKKPTYYGFHEFSGLLHDCDLLWSGWLKVSGVWRDGTRIDLEGHFQNTPRATPGEDALPVVPLAPTQQWVPLRGEARVPDGHSARLVDVLQFFLEVDKAEKRAYISVASGGTGSAVWTHPPSCGPPPHENPFLSVWPPLEIHVALIPTDCGEPDIDPGGGIWTDETCRERFRACAQDADLRLERAVSACYSAIGLPEGHCRIHQLSTCWNSPEKPASSTCIGKHCDAPPGPDAWGGDPAMEMITCLSSAMKQHTEDMHQCSKALMRCKT